MRRTILILAVLCGPFVATQGYANDSQAEVGLGGLVLTKSDAIRMDSEDLSISEERIRVDYVFTNTSDRDIETLVAFPLPTVVNGNEVPAPDYARDLAFETTVDGHPAQLELRQSATFKGVDITARLTALGLTAMPVNGVFDTAIDRLSPEVRKGLIAEGLIGEDGTDGTRTLWAAHWTTATTVTRTQVFPAGRSIAVSHAYKPFVGGSVGGRFDPTARRERGFSAIRSKYCVDDAFLAGLDRKIVEARKSGATYGESWVSYVLTSGANWKGPIGRFRMVIDKGAADAMVSFCADGVRKIDATRFESVRQNFVPKRNVDVLIVRFAK